MLVHSSVRAFALLALTALLMACSETAVSSPPPVSAGVLQATQVPAPPTVSASPPASTQATQATQAPAPTQAPAAAADSKATALPAAANTQALAAHALVLARGAVPQRLYAVMIDNHPDAYPQTGLDKAPLVFESLAEFGITRYMAVFAPGISPDARVIGPVRSARAYFVQWAMGLQAVYAHAGGSPDGLELAQSAQEIVNADALGRAAGSYFRRDNKRVAPHNLYTDSAALAQLVSDKQVAAFDAANLGFLLKPDAPPSKRPADQRLSYFFIYREEPVGWVYDPDSNSYRRLRRDKAHVDGLTGKQLVFKNVLVMEVDEGLRRGDAKGRIDQQVVGEGRAYLFVDGAQHSARWRKESPAAPLRFYDDQGAEVQLNAGPVWIAALPSLDHLTIRGGTAATP